MTTDTPEIEIFTGPGCGYCEAAKRMLAAHGLGVRERDIANAAVRAEMKARLPRERTIPQVFIDGAHVGGAEDLEIWLGQRG